MEFTSGDKYTYIFISYLNISQEVKILLCQRHYNDVIMTMIASQITSLTVVYSTVYSDANQRKHESSASLAFVWGIHRDRWIPRTKGQLRGKCFHLMTSLWQGHFTLHIVNTPCLLMMASAAIVLTRFRRIFWFEHQNGWRFYFPRGTINSSVDPWHSHISKYNLSSIVTKSSIT